MNPTASESSAEATVGGAATKGARISPRRRTLLLSSVGLVLVMGTLATAFAPVLAAHHPLLLIALNSRNPFLVLAHDVGVVPFALVALVRRGIGESVFFFLGRAYGPNALAWLQKRQRARRVTKTIEKGVHRAAYPMVVFLPGAMVFTLAGATGVRPVGFFACNVGGTLIAIATIRTFKDSFSGPIDAAIAFIDRNLVVATSISVGCVVLSLIVQTASGRFRRTSGILSTSKSGPQKSEDST